MQIVNEQVLGDGSVAVLLTGDIDRLPPVASPGLGIKLRCAGHSWLVVLVEIPEPEGGIPVARAVLRGPTHPRKGMILRLQNDPLSPEEVDAFVEALTHFWKIARSVDGDRLGEALVRYRKKYEHTAERSRLLGVGEFLGLAALVTMVNRHLDLFPGIEDALAQWRVVAEKTRSVLDAP